MNFYKISKFLLYLAPFAVVIVTPSTLFPFIVGKYTFFKIIIELALIFFILGWGFQRNFKFEILNFKLWRYPLVLAVTAFVAIFTLAGFAGINPHSSFWSNFERGEGVFLMLHLFAFFILLVLLFTKEKDWKNLFRVAVTAGILVMLYGIMAAMGVRGFVGNPICDRFAGSLGNPAYIGTFSVFMLFYVGYLTVSRGYDVKKIADWLIAISGFILTYLFLFLKFYRSYNLYMALGLSLSVSLPVFILLYGFYLLISNLFFGKENPYFIFFWFLIICFFYFLLLSQTRGGFLGLGIGIISALVFLGFALPSRSWRKISIGIAILLIVMGLLGIYYRKYINLAPWCEGGGNRILDVSFEGETINTRFALWQQSIEAWKDRPILGWGPENFSIAFEKHFNPVHEVWFDRAHNIFFDYLVFAGILGLLSFVGMFVVFYWQFFSSNKEQRTKDTEQKSSHQHKKESSMSYVLSYQSALQRALIFALPIAYLVQGLVLFDVLPIYINLFLFLAFVSWKLSNRSNR